MKTTTGRSTFPRKYDATVVTSHLAHTAWRHIPPSPSTYSHSQISFGALMYLCRYEISVDFSREAFKESSLLISYEEQQTSQPSRCKNFEGPYHAWITELEVLSIV